jgi:hypothetical protein
MIVMRLLILFSFSILITACGSNRIRLVNKRVQHIENKKKEECVDRNSTAMKENSLPHAVFKQEIAQNIQRDTSPNSEIEILAINLNSSDNKSKVCTKTYNINSLANDVLVEKSDQNRELQAGSNGQKRYKFWSWIFIILGVGLIVPSIILLLFGPFLFVVGELLCAGLITLGLVRLIKMKRNYDVGSTRKENRFLIRHLILLRLKFFSYYIKNSIQRFRYRETNKKRSARTELFWAILALLGAIVLILFISALISLGGSGNAAFYFLILASIVVVTSFILWFIKINRAMKADNNQSEKIVE